MTDATERTMIVRCRNCGQTVVLSPVYQVIVRSTKPCDAEGPYSYFDSFRALEQNKPVPYFS